MCLVTGLAASSEANTGGKRADCSRRGNYECGDTKISRCAQCVCGDNTFSYEDYVTVQLPQFVVLSSTTVQIKLCSISSYTCSMITMYLDKYISPSSTTEPFTV